MAVLLAAVMAILTALTGGSASPVAAFWGAVAKPFQMFTVGVADSIASSHEATYRYDIVLQENAELKKRIAEMEEAERQSVATGEENDRLRKLLGLAERHRDFTWETAMITASGTSNWASTFTINKGSQQGLEPKMCVVTEEGFLIGFLSEVGPGFSIVTTLIDTDMECGAYISRSGDGAVVEGNFDLMRQGLLRLSYLSKDTDLRNGDLVLASGIGGVFPRDIVIGAIESVQVDSSGISAYAVIRPSVDLNRLTHVSIIKSFDISE